MAELNDLNVTDASNTARFPENQNPSTVNDGARKLEGMIARYIKDSNGSVAVAGTDTYTATINADSGFALYDGWLFCGDFANANTGAATLNVTPDGGSALGAKSIVKKGGTALVAGDITAGMKVLLVYDGTNMQMLSQSGTSADVITAQGDVIRGDSSGDPEALTIGAANTILRSDGTDAAWGNITGPEIVIGSDAAGDILYRNGSNYTRLAIGSANEVLAVNSGATAPEWVAARGITEIVAATALPSANNVDITDIAQTYAALILTVNGASSDTASRYLLVQCDTDNGASFDSTAGNYLGTGIDQTTPASNANASIGPGTTGVVTAAQTISFSVVISNYQAGGYTTCHASGIRNTVHISSLITWTNTGALDALRIIWNSTGNFDAGTYSLYGVN